MNRDTRFDEERRWRDDRRTGPRWPTRHESDPNDFDDYEQRDRDRNRDMNTRDRWPNDERVTRFGSDRRDWDEYDMPRVDNRGRNDWDRGNEYDENGLLGRRGYRSGNDMNTRGNYGRSSQGWNPNSEYEERRERQFGQGGYNWPDENWGQSDSLSKRNYNRDAGDWNDRRQGMSMWTRQSWGQGWTQDDGRWTDQDGERGRGMQQGLNGEHRGKGPKGYQRSDDRIREDVSECLRDNPYIDASDIDVTVRDGVVKLAGQVENRQVRRLSEACIEHISGVKDVDNQLRARGGNAPNTGQEDRTQDTKNRPMTKERSATTAQT